MTVVILEAASPGLRGYLTRWMLEIRAGVFVGRVSARVRELVEDKERTKEIHDAISQGYTTYGMQTFDQSLMQLLSAKFITYEEALRWSSNPDDFALRVSGVGGTSDSRWDDFEGSGGGGQKPGQRVITGSVPAQPQSQAPASGNDDFKIERF